MSDNIYTANLNDQEPAVALNSVLWRLAVATRLVDRGSERVALDPNYVLHEAEEQLTLFHTSGGAE